MVSRVPTRSLLLSLALTALTITAYAAAEPPRQKGEDYYTKKVCKVQRSSGSRLGGVRRCMTQAEFDRERAAERKTIERIQTMKTTSGQ